MTKLYTYYKQNAIEIYLNNKDIVLQESNNSIIIPFTELYDAMFEAALLLINDDKIAVRRRAESFLWQH